MRKVVFLKKIDRKNAISICILIANLFISKHIFFVVKLPYATTNSFTTTIVLFLEYHLAKSEIFLLSIIDNCLQYNFNFAISEFFLSKHFLQLCFFWNFVYLEECLSC